MQAYSNVRRSCLDLLDDAIAQYKAEGMRGIDWVFMHMTERERLAFDLWLVKMKDPLAYEAGTTEHRFKTRALSMARGIPTAEALADAQDNAETED